MRLDLDSRIEARQLKAVQEAKSSKRLFHIWKKSPYVDVRGAAIHKLNEQAMLEIVARNERMIPLRCEAVRKLKNVAPLSIISSEDEDETVKYIAKRKLEYTDCDSYKDLADMDDNAAKALSMILEHNARLDALATGKRDDEEWW